MVMAADLSVRLGWLSESDLGRLQQLIHKANLPELGPADLQNSRYLELMSVDKKAEAGKIRLVLQKRIGEAVMTDQFPQEKLLETLDHCRQTS